VSRVQKVSAAEVNAYGVGSVSGTLPLGRVWIDEYSFNPTSKTATHVQSFHFPHRAQDLNVVTNALSTASIATVAGSPRNTGGAVSTLKIDQTQFLDVSVNINNMYKQVLTLPWDDAVNEYNVLGQITLSADRCSVAIGGLGVPIEDVTCAGTSPCATTTLFSGFASGSAAATSPGPVSGLDYSSGYPVSMARISSRGWNQDAYSHWLPFTTGTMSSSTPSNANTLITLKYFPSTVCGTNIGGTGGLSTSASCDYYKPDAVRATNLAQVPRAVAIGSSQPKLAYSTTTYIDGRTDSTGQTISNTGNNGGMWSRCWSGQLYARNTATTLIGSPSTCAFPGFKAVDPGNDRGSMGICQIGSSSGDLHLLQVRASDASAIFTHPSNGQTFVPELLPSAYGTYWPSALGVGSIGTATSTGGTSQTSTLRGCAGFTPDGSPAIASGTFLFWVDRGASNGYALQRSSYTSSWAAAVPVWPNAAHSNSNLYVSGALVPSGSLASSLANFVAAATMDANAQLFVVTGGVGGTVYASTNPRADVSATPISFYQLIVLGVDTAATWQFANSVYRGVSMAPSSCVISNNDFRRSLETEEEGPP